MEKKFERCIKKVKKSKRKVNPYAVCRAALSKKELKIGIMIEKKEHGFNLKVSRKIAMDHIKEFPRYYTHKRYGLISIEKKMKKLRKG